MWQQALKSFLVTVSLVFLLGAPVIYSLKKDSSRPVSPQKEVNQTQKINSAFKKTAQINLLRQQFMDSGWPRDAAKAVIDLNSNWFLTIAAENDLALSKQIILLEGLGDYEFLMPFLTKHPEAAGLFAMATDPRSLLELLESTKTDYDLLINLYVLHASPVDADALTEALKNNADLVSKLYHRGLTGCEVIFIFTRDDEGAFEYEQWLRELLQTKMNSSDREMASLLNMLLLYGPDIRQRLRNDFAFRKTFRSTIWPKMVRVASLNNNMFEIYLDDPRVWDLLALAEGEELLKSRGPLLPIDLLYGYSELGRSPYPEDLHRQVIQVLLNGDEQTIRAMLKFREEPLFHALLRRPVSPKIKAAAFKKLESTANYHELLKRYDKMSDTGLTTDVGPAPGILKIWTPFYYTLWEVPKKLIQGRNPSGTEWFNSIADPVSFLYPIIKIGVVVVNVGKSLTVIKKDAPMNEELKKTSLELAEQQLGKEIAHTLSDKELVKFAVTGMLAEMQKVYKKNISHSVLFNTTKPVAFMMSYSGTGHNTLKSLNKIDGQYLMRGDAKLVVQPNNDMAGKEASNYLFRTSQSFITSSLDQSQKESLGRLLKKDENSPDSKQQLTIWRQNVSAWWLLHASGILR
jgi:hypothetical protein